MELIESNLNIWLKEKYFSKQRILLRGWNIFVGSTKLFSKKSKNNFYETESFCEQSSGYFNFNFYSRYKYCICLFYEEIFKFKFKYLILRKIIGNFFFMEKSLECIRSNRRFWFKFSRPVYKRIILSFSNGLVYIMSWSYPIFRLELKLLFYSIRNG